MVFSWFFSLFICLISVSAWSQVPVDLLSKQTLERVERVPEFKFIQDEANKLGVKVYLFGGTASAFAHYVRWDLEREAGDEKYQAERFDYDFTNIYRGNQDLDIVVDGTAEQAQELKSILQKAYPHFVGNRSSWEVRLLREELGDKLPLLGDDDFVKQHSDTNSTGMVALNPDEDDEIIFRDLHDWENPKSRFLKDVAAAKIKYLFSKEHETTERYQTGHNPPILSAVRYIAKLTQYEVKGTVADMKLIKKVISEAIDGQILNSYSKSKVIEFGLKALRNAPNIEYAWDLLEEVGLREYIIMLDDSYNNSTDSPSFWMQKEPLRTSKLGDSKQGKTARQVFGEEEDIIVSHETRSFEAYESITRSAKGEANVFISRNGAMGEAAVHGDGFYTKLGESGAIGSGITVRFKLHPDAVEGPDFTRHSSGIVLIHNKAALTLIQENIHLTLFKFLELILSDQIGSDDKGLMEKLNRKFARYKLDDEEHKQIAEEILISDHDDFIALDEIPLEFLSYWFAHPNAANYEGVLEELSEYYDCGDVVSCLMPHAHWQDYLNEEYDLVDTFNNEVNSVNSRALVIEGLAKPHWQGYPELITPFLSDDHNLEALIKEVLADPYWLKHPKLIAKIIDNFSTSSQNTSYLVPLATHIFSQEEWAKHSVLFEKLVEAYLKYGNTELADALLSHAFSKKHWAHRSDLMGDMVKDYHLSFELASTLGMKHWSSHPDFVEKLVEQNPHFEERILMIKHIFSKEHWWKKVKHLLPKFIEDNNTHDYIAEYILTQDFAFSKKIINQMVAVDTFQRSLIEYVLPKEENKDTELLLKLAGDAENHEPIIEHILSKEFYSDQAELVEKMVALEAGLEIDNALVEYVFASPFWELDHLVEAFIEDGRASGSIMVYILSQDDHPKQSEWIKKAMEDGGYGFLEELTEEDLMHENWKKSKNLMREILSHDLSYDSLELLSAHILNDSFWGDQDDVVKLFAAQKEAGEFLISNILPYSASTLNRKILENIIDNDFKDAEVVEEVLSNEEWATHPNLVMKILTEGVADNELATFVFSKRYWNEHEVFWDYLGGDDDEITVATLRRKNHKVPFASWYENYLNGGGSDAIGLTCSGLLK